MPDFDNDLLLITCASGKQATALLPHVIPKWKHIRLQVLSTASKARLEKQYPTAEVICADMADPTACRKLLDDVSSCFLVGPPLYDIPTCIHSPLKSHLLATLPPFSKPETRSTNASPSSHPQETTLCTNIISAASPNTHILYTSVLHPMLRKLLNHDSKRYTEETLLESGLSYTILQPSTLMENLPLAHLLSSSQERPTYPINWDPATKFSFTTTLDIAEAAYAILIAPENHVYATYEIVSTPSPLSYTEAIAIVSEEIGKEIKVERRSLEEAADVGVKIVAGGKEVTREMRDVGVRMFLYYCERGLLGNSNVLEMLLGRKPRDYRTWVRERVREIREGEEKEE